MNQSASYCFYKYNISWSLMHRQHIGDRRDVEEEISVWNDIKDFGKGILPFVAVAALGASALGAVKLLGDKRRENPTIDHAVSDFQHLEANMGEAACVKLLLRFSCISPDWHVQYFRKVDELTEIYGNFHALIEHCENNMYCIEDALASNGSQVSNDDIKRWRIGTCHAKYVSATMLHDAIVMRTSIISMSTQLLQLTRAWNKYWSAVGNIFLSPSPIMPSTPNEIMHPNNTQSPHIEKSLQMLSIKERQVISLRMSGLDTILKIGAEAASGSNRKSEDIASTMMDLGSANKVVTTHVGWWAKMHTTFLPQMKLVASKLGWTADGDHLYSEMVKLVENQTPSADATENKKRRTIVTQTTPLPNTKSSVPEQIHVWKARLLQEGIGSVIMDPWSGFQPSPWEETFIPTCDLDTKAVQVALMTMQKKLDANIEFMFQCASYVENSSCRITVAAGTLGMTNPTVWSPEEQDVALAQYNELSSQASHRIKVYESIWNRMSI